MNPQAVRFQSDRRDGRIEIVFDDGGMNLLSNDALRELRALIDGIRAQHAESEAQLVLRSGHSRIFAAGADMAEMRSFSASEAESFSRQGQELFEAIERLPMLTIVLIDGDCFGGALDLAMSFDVRLATPRSRFSHPGSRLGIVTGFGGTSRWRKIVGRPAASALMIGNRVLSAGEATSFGVVDHVSDDHAEELERLARIDPVTAHFLKELTRVSDRLSRSQLLLMARTLGNLYFGE